MWVPLPACCVCCLFLLLLTYRPFESIWLVVGPFFLVLLERWAWFSAAGGGRWRRSRSIERALVLMVGWRALDLGGGALRACVSFVLPRFFCLWMQVWEEVRVGDGFEPSPVGRMVAARWASGSWKWLLCFWGWWWNDTIGSFNTTPDDYWKNPWEPWEKSCLVKWQVLVSSFKRAALAC